MIYLKNYRMGRTTRTTSISYSAKVCKLFGSRCYQKPEQNNQIFNENFHNWRPIQSTKINDFATISKGSYLFIRKNLIYSRLYLNKKNKQKLLTFAYFSRTADKTCLKTLPFYIFEKRMVQRGPVITEGWFSVMNQCPSNSNCVQAFLSLTSASLIRYRFMIGQFYPRDWNQCSLKYEVVDF